MRLTVCGGGLMCQQLCSLPAFLGQLVSWVNTLPGCVNTAGLYEPAVPLYGQCFFLTRLCRHVSDFILSTQTGPYLPRLSRTAHGHVGTYTIGRSLRSTPARILWAIMNGPLRADRRNPLGLDLLVKWVPNLACFPLPLHPRQGSNLEPPLPSPSLPLDFYQQRPHEQDLYQGDKPSAAQDGFSLTAFHHLF